MISLSHLNKTIIYILLFTQLFVKVVSSEEDTVDIWKIQENQKSETTETDRETDTTIKSPILSDNINKLVIKIDENEIKESGQKIIGIFDPEENNFNLDMWSKTDGEDIKKILNRINKLRLAKLSEDLLFQILFTNAYPPEKNLNAEEFLRIKIDWLIKNKRINDLETLLKNNPESGNQVGAVKFLIDEYLSSADIKAACEKINFISPEVQNDYLDKFLIYCLINNGRGEEAQLIYDLLKERGFKDNFFENKINFLLGISEKTSQEVVDNNLLNFFLSHITSDDFQYEPNEKTNKYIWRYLSSANLIEVNNLESEEIIFTYEQAAAQNSFEKEEIFKIYLRMNYSFAQLKNSEEIYKNLPNYEARALIYQSILLADNAEKKVSLAILLKSLFVKDQILEVYTDELSNILKSIDINEISENYVELVNENLNKKISPKVKFDNEILHRSKVIKHFLENNTKLTRTEKDFKSVYKKIKRNKKYFISIKDIVVLESLMADGISVPEDIDYKAYSEQITVPQNLIDLAAQNQIGLVMLKIVEIIGEDKVGDLDPETIYFLNSILNELNLKKIRNNILSEALPAKV